MLSKQFKHRSASIIFHQRFHFSKPNPFQRSSAQQGFTQTSQQPDPSKFLIKKTPREKKIQYARIKTNLKQKVINPLIGLLTDVQFLIRFVAFGGLIGAVYQLALRREDQGIQLFVEVEEDNTTSQTKYSKTFGHEKKLDEILTKLKEKEVSKA